MRRWDGGSHQLVTEARNGARACGGTHARRRGLAAGAAHRHALDSAQARGDGRPGPGWTRAIRTCSTWRAISSPATASRPGCSPSTSAPPTGGSRTTSTDCCAAAGFAEPVRLPGETLILDHYGLARELSLPIDADAWHNELVSSYRLDNGVLHNPVNDRRTTQGVFHVAEGGLPIPADKTARAARRRSCGCCRRRCGRPPTLMRLPFTASWPEPVETMVSLLLRPLVCPAVPKVTPEKRMEVRFFVPGGLVSNLDFVESIFGNAGDPYLPGHDAGARRRRLDRPQRLRDPRAPPHPAAQEGPRPAARERGHRGGARGRHVLGDRERAVQQRPAVQDHVAQPSRA